MLRRVEPSFHMGKKWPSHVGSSKNMKIGVVSGARGSRAVGDERAL